MTTRFHAILLLFGAILLLANCKKDADLPYRYESEALNLPATPYNYSHPSLPAHLATLQQAIETGVKDEVATLGRVLFYDPKLSIDNKIACASCHHQEKGFADAGTFSLGTDGQHTKRNSPSITNPATMTAFFWDGRETDLQEMVLQPVKNHVEMGMDNFDALERKLGSVDYYAPLFEQAFGDKTVTRERMATALKQFLMSMASGNSRFDGANPTGWGVQSVAGFTPQENEGLNLFFGAARCANCHNENFGFNSGSQWADIGLEENYEEDMGLGAFTPGQAGLFKIPSLRNVALTAPYMHDGRFATLMDVVNHYSDNIQNSPNLNWALREGSGPVRMNLTQQEKEALIAFLGTFTDQSYVTDKKYSNPFK